MSEPEESVDDVLLRTVRELDEAIKVRVAAEREALGQSED